MTELVISFTLDGLHFWPNAPKQYEEFSHLHRHLFKFVCFCHQRDSDDPARRERELWELRQDAIRCIRENYGNEPVNFGTMSCEGIGDSIKSLMGFSKVFVGEEWFLGAIVQ